MYMYIESRIDTTLKRFSITLVNNVTIASAQNVFKIPEEIK